MLIDETNDELYDCIESLVYILGDRMEIGELSDKLEQLIDKAIADVEVDKSA